MVPEWLSSMMFLTVSLGDYVLAGSRIDGDINKNYKEIDDQKVYGFSEEKKQKQKETNIESLEKTDFSEDRGVSKHAIDDWFSYGMSYTNSIFGQDQQCLRTRGYEEGQKVSRGLVLKDMSQEKNSKRSKRRLKGSRRKRKKERRKKVSKWIKKKQDKELNAKWSSPKRVKIRDRKDMKHSYGELEECSNSNNDKANTKIEKCRHNSDRSGQNHDYLRRDDGGD